MFTHDPDLGTTGSSNTPAPSVNPTTEHAPNQPAAVDLGHPRFRWTVRLDIGDRGDSLVHRTLTCGHWHRLLPAAYRCRDRMERRYRLVTEGIEMGEWFSCWVSRASDVEEPTWNR